ncbi:MAG: hydrolase 1, exosortase A system-associated [Gammaproteobacteria bacterium]|nr:hydrolase 1, exosortase A system-associated [Gammaproteobacteria bacterium]
MTERALLFGCEGALLAGILHAPAPAVSATGVLIIVGGPQYRVGSHRQFTLLAREIAARGHAVMRFDVRGMGDSEGESPGFEALGPDIRAALAEFLRQVPAIRSVVLWGLCDGASAALLNCDAHPAVAGLVLVNPWVRTGAGEARAVMRHYYFQRLLQRSFWRKVLAGQWSLVRSLQEFAGVARRAQREDTGGVRQSGSFLARMLSTARRYEDPILLLISEQDLTAAEFVDLCRDSAEWRSALARKNVSWERLRGADHTFSGREHLQAAVRVTCQWLASVASPVR